MKNAEVGIEVKAFEQKNAELRSFFTCCYYTLTKIEISSLHSEIRSITPCSVFQIILLFTHKTSLFNIRLFFILTSP